MKIFTISCLCILSTSMASNINLMAVLKSGADDPGKVTRSALVNELKHKMADLNLTNGQVSFTPLDSVKIDIYDVPVELKATAFNILTNSNLYETIEEDAEVHIMNSDIRA